MRGAHGRCVIGGSFDCCLVDERLQVRSREPDGTASDHGDVNLLLVVADVAHVVREDLDTSSYVGKGYYDVAVESSWSNECLVEGFGKVGGSDEDDTFSGRESVELNEELVESLLDVVLVLGRTLASDRVQLVDEDDAGSGLASSGEELTNTASSNSDVPRVRRGISWVSREREVEVLTSRQTRIQKR